MSKHDLIAMTEALEGGYGTYHALIAHSLGLNAAVILDKLVYWNEHVQNQQDGYFYKTAKMLYSETGIKTDAQSRALHKLQKLGLISADKYDYRHRRKFKVNMTSVMNYCNELRKNPELNYANNRNQFDGIRQTIYKKNQSEFIKQRAHSHFAEDENGREEYEVLISDMESEVVKPYYESSFGRVERKEPPVIL
jgi:hypothetical protein